MTNTRFTPVPNDGYPAGANGGNMTDPERIHYHALSAVRELLGITLHETRDANGSYLHGRLDDGSWVVATDANGYAYALRDRIAHETATVCECCGDDREPTGLGWSVGIYSNCTRCGDDHPADHDGSIADAIDYDAMTDQLSDTIRRALAELTT